MDWCLINEDYLRFLKSKESRVPNFEYYDSQGNKTLKPFFGVLFSKGDISYITQVSSPKQRHNNMREMLDFKKIYDDVNLSQLICVVNLNYMFPVPTKELMIISSVNLAQTRNFNSQLDMQNYISLLNKELSQLNNSNIINDSVKVYDLKRDFPQAKVSQRCFNFKDLESEAQKWNDIHKIVESYEDITKDRENVVIKDKLIFLEESHTIKEQLEGILLNDDLIEIATFNRNLITSINNSLDKNQDLIINLSHSKEFER